MRGQRRSTIAALALVALAAGPVPAAEPSPDWVDSARAAAAGLGGTLKQELQAAIAEGGPVQGIETCRVRAPEIARERSGPDLRVGRTALRVRNPDNAPDDWERTVLADFQQRLADGAAPGDLQAWIETEVDGRPIGRWMKAIPTQPLCLTCHGDTLAPELADAIRDAYPEDRATGFAVGDLRGAFTVEVALDPDD